MASESEFLVVPSRIELESRASETLILSIVLQDQGYIFPLGGSFQEFREVAAEDLYGNGQQNYAKKFTYSNHTCLS